ncbi:hypothetical protein TVAG_434720 [Trichomonas vaginalis G3]|uniref:DNA-directed DNA polymerase n=1 Tax=Trichomonas vaginalis (strain ATCC PRA-98 / G3) TaxID=412133 RepID=A2DSQ5_TRIV3|nr:organellar and viral DNA polymerase type B [Trichomonas vaginalis G3]EAY16635.1 hypothetical protein TVAG_434720 [Trichomonas vaginalis G3]KAI5533014.1 organellar and viral DNA polymerase type B [Trichomonas vaginalis G3]|eukprot:XP_001328858.1 hypothetical protein [Trichomonas vaginalis G3]
MINAEKERGTFDMFKYCEFYCEQDVNVLRVGFGAFRSVCLQEPINMDIYNITTVPSLANKFLNREVFYPNGNLYEISGSVKEYIMGAIYGGCCMTKNNKRYVVKDKLNDFDACSLYPSAMNRLFTIEGKPEIINECLIDDKIYDDNNPHPLLVRAFDEDQTEPTKDKDLSYFVVDIEITNVGKSRDFPLIVLRDENGLNRNVNETGFMRVDMIALQDLVKYQNISYKILGGLIWKGNRDHRIRNTIRKIYDLRRVYKKAEIRWKKY